MTTATCCVLRPVITLAAMQDCVAGPSREYGPFLRHKCHEMRFVIALQVRKIATIESHVAIDSYAKSHRPYTNNSVWSHFGTVSEVTNHVGAGALTRPAGRSPAVFSLPKPCSLASSARPPGRGVRAYVVRGGGIRQLAPPALRLLTFHSLFDQGPSPCLKLPHC
jgi:hypothetical protein